MRIAMVGTGYVGLVSGACFSDFGHQVICVDKDATKIETLNQGGVPIYEPGLDLLIAKNVREGRLGFSVEPADAMRNADVIFIAVGTPSRRGDGHADLQYVYAAAKEIAGLIDGFTVIVTKINRPRGHRRRGRAGDPRDQPGCGFHRCVEPGIPARRCGDRRFQTSGPRCYRD